MKTTDKKTADSIIPNVSICGFLRRTRAANSAVGGLIRPNCLEVVIN